MATLIVLRPSSTGTAPLTQSKAGSPALMTVAGRADTHPTPRISSLPRAFPGRVTSSNTTPNGGRAGASTPPARPMASVTLFGDAMGREVHRDPVGRDTSTRRSSLRVIKGGLPCIGAKAATPTTRERGGWTFCPSRTAPLRIVPSRSAGSGRDTTVRPIRPAANKRTESSPEMAQTPHPLDLEVEEMYETYQLAAQVFKRDEEIDPDEHRILQLITSHYRDIADYRLREEFADSYKRNGLSRVTRDRARDADLQVIDLASERRKRANNIIPLFPDQERA